MNTDPQLLILVTLAGGSRHGYAVQQEIEEAFGVRLGPGTLYGAIARLEQRGLICGIGWDGRKRPYEITTEGRIALAERLAVLSSVVSLGHRRLASA